MNVKYWWNDTDGGKTEILKREICPIGILSTTDPIWIGPGSNSVEASI